MRSAEAAKSTAALIDASVDSAEDGVSFNQEVLQNLEEISSRVNKVSAVMAEIAAASEQQSQGIEQINTAVDQISNVTQRNAAHSEETAASAEELHGQAGSLRSAVASFRLGQLVEGGDRPVVAPAPGTEAVKPRNQLTTPVKTSTRTASIRGKTPVKAGRNAPAVIAEAVLETF
jgi:methyl-accepting chemotaxis protein